MRVPPNLPPQSDSDAAPPVRPVVPAPAQGRLRLLVSACLLGERVRYDGQHKYDPFLVETLGRFVEFVRVCPEVDCGMPTPRPSMHLVGEAASPRLVSRTGEDLTEQMQRFARSQVERYAGLELCGYVCKKDSPSSGMTRVKVYPPVEGRMPERSGAGLFTRAFMERWPLIPVEEEGRLNDPGLREAFIERVFCMRRWYDLVRGGTDRGRLVEFHADHKYLLLGHGRAGYTELGRLVAEAKRHPPAELYRRYLEGFAAALAVRTTPKKVTDVLQHMMGFFKRDLDAEEKAELLQTLSDYKAGQVPLVVPLTLIKHYVRKFGVEYLERQVFLNPYPAELMLRNHV
ncbi:MAG TPA: DUF523 and DUF1722 domain-containing protein [Myxococcales bacterium]